MPTLSLTDPQRLRTGLFPLTHPLQAPMWIDGENIALTPRGVSSAKGYAAAFNSGTTGPIRGLFQRQTTAGVKEIFFGDLSAIYRWDGTVSTVGSGFTLQQNDTATQQADKWIFAPWGDWVVASNGRDPVQVYKGTSFAALAGVTFNWAKVIMPWSQFMFAAHTSNGLTIVEWCRAGNVEDWVPQAGSEAGNLIIREFNTPIRAMAPLSQAIGVYSDDRMAIIRFVGAPFWFGYTFALDGIGAVGPFAVAADGRLNYGVSRAGIWRTDGVSFEFIDGPIKDWLKQNVNWSQASKIVAFRNEAEGTIDFSFPTVGGEPDTVWRYYPLFNAWVKLDRGFSAALERNVFDWPILGLPDGRVVYEGFGDTADGATLTSRVTSRLFALGSMWHRKLVRRLRLIVEGSPQVRVGHVTRPHEAVNWGLWKVADGNELPLREAGVLFSFELQGTTPWEFGGLEVDFQPIGFDTDDTDRP